jgi:hypothetical protein
MPLNSESDITLINRIQFILFQRCPADGLILIFQSEGVNVIG